MNRSRRATERGDSLVFALVALGVGTLLLSPLLLSLTSRHEVTKAVEDRMRSQYTTDAAIEYAIWRVQNDAAWREALTDEVGAQATITLPTTVNGAISDVQVIYVGGITSEGEGEGGGGGGGGHIEMVQAPWAIWATGTSDTAISITGSESVIRGDVHSKGRVNFAAWKGVIKGDVHSAGDLMLDRDQVKVEGSIYSDGNVTLAQSVALVEGDVYAKGYVKLDRDAARVMGDVHAGHSVILSQSDTQIDGRVYSDGAVTLSRANARILGDVYADDAVTMSGSTTRLASNLYSDAAVTLSGQGATIAGTLYGDGVVSITGWQAQIVGGIVKDGATEDLYTYAAPALQLDPPLSFNLADFRPGGAYALAAQAEGKYHQPALSKGKWTVSAYQAVIPEGLYYVAGDVVLSGAELVASNVTIVAEGTISISKNQPKLGPAYIPGLALYSASSANDAIAISANQFTCDGGIIYAPNGGATLSSSQLVHRGAFLVKTLTSSSWKADIGLAPGLLIPRWVEGGGGGDGETLCEVFDLRAGDQGVTTTARVRFCTEATPVVESWHVN